jgi:hypothetical protein
MKKAEFQIKREFFTASGRWMCTDVGSRVITAIKKDMPDDSWYSGPPYAVVETTFDEHDQAGCVSTYAEARENWGEDFVSAERTRRSSVTVRTP